jgi:hypothetical protein
MTDRNKPFYSTTTAPVVAEACTSCRGYGHEIVPRPNAQYRQAPCRVCGGTGRAADGARTVALNAAGDVGAGLDIGVDYSVVTTGPLVPEGGFAITIQGGTLSRQTQENIKAHMDAMASRYHKSIVVGGNGDPEETRRLNEKWRDDALRNLGIDPNSEATRLKREAVRGYLDGYEARKSALSQETLDRLNAHMAELPTDGYTPMVNLAASQADIEEVMFNMGRKAGKPVYSRKAAEALAKHAATRHGDTTDKADGGSERRDADHASDPWAERPERFYDVMRPSAAGLGAFFGPPAKLANFRCSIDPDREGRVVTPGSSKPTDGGNRLDYRAAIPYGFEHTKLLNTRVDAKDRTIHVACDTDLGTFLLSTSRFLEEGAEIVFQVDNPDVRAVTESIRNDAELKAHKDRLEAITSYLGEIGAYEAVRPFLKRIPQNLARDSFESAKLTTGEFNEP